MDFERRDAKCAIFSGGSCLYRLTNSKQMRHANSRGELGYVIGEGEGGVGHSPVSRRRLSPAAPDFPIFLGTIHQRPHRLTWSNQIRTVTRLWKRCVFTVEYYAPAFEGAGPSSHIEIFGIYLSCQRGHGATKFEGDHAGEG